MNSSFYIDAPLKFCMGTGELLQLGIEDPNSSDKIILSIDNPVITHIELRQDYITHLSGSRPTHNTKIADGPIKIQLELTSYNAKTTIGDFDFTDPILNRSISDLLAAVQVKLSRGERS